MTLIKKNIQNDNVQSLRINTDLTVGTLTLKGLFLFIFFDIFKIERCSFFPNHLMQIKVRICQGH